MNITIQEFPYNYKTLLFWRMECFLVKPVHCYTGENGIVEMSPTVSVLIKDLLKCRHWPASLQASSGGEDGMLYSPRSDD